MVSRRSTNVMESEKIEMNNNIHSKMEQISNSLVFKCELLLGSSESLLDALQSGTS